MWDSKQDAISKNILFIMDTDTINKSCWYQTIYLTLFGQTFTFLLFQIASFTFSLYIYMHIYFTLNDLTEIDTLEQSNLPSECIIWLWYKVTSKIGYQLRIRWIKLCDKTNFKVKSKNSYFMGWGSSNLAGGAELIYCTFFYSSCFDLWHVWLFNKKWHVLSARRHGNCATT